MNIKGICVALVGAAGLLLPSVLVGQVDPGAAAGNPFPQQSQGMGQSGAQPNTQPNGQPGLATPSSGQTIPSGSMRDSLGAPGETGQAILDKQFVRTAYQNGLADVKIGGLAIEKGGPDVKELAQKLVDDHEEMNKDLASVADSMGVMLPKKVSKEDQEEYEKLNGLSGKDFDTEYVLFLAKAHRQTVHSFYMEAQVAAEPGLQAEVVKSLTTMHQHLGMIAKVAKDDSITLPPRPPRPGATTAKQ